jgi:hypothetical protein
MVVDTWEGLARCEIDCTLDEVVKKEETKIERKKRS